MKNFNQNYNNVQNPSPDNCRPHAYNPLKRVFVGLFFIIVGALVLGHRMGYISGYMYHLIISWQMLLIAIGFLQLLSFRRSLSGLILIALGVLFLLPRILIIPVSLAHLTFPIALLLVGLIILIRSFFKPNHQNFHRHFDDSLIDFSNDYINEKYVFGGGNVHVISKNFKGGKIEGVFGGGRIDFSDAVLSTEGKNVLEVELVFGGLEIIVPRDWTIIIRANSVFGAIVEKRPAFDLVTDPSKELVIIGKTVFGGGEIKRV